MCENFWTLPFCFAANDIALSGNPDRGFCGSVQKFSHIQFRLSGARHWLKR
jgi:hypothetical protein